MKKHSILSAAVLLCLLAASCSSNPSTKLHEDLLARTTHLAIGYHGKMTSHGDFFLDEQVVVKDELHRNQLIHALLYPGRYEVHENTTFEPDVYVVLLFAKGDPLAAVSFNGQWMQVVEARKEQGKIMIHNGWRFPNYWTRVPRLNQVFRSIWKEEQGLRATKRG
ncbi:MAG: hypothetical protein NTY98_10150 [Verrucomicrobia bacterium]|nr:hypothetical protein [Verrucomicrobiota bacterium]